MNRRFLYICGVVAPVLFLLTALLGGALRPGYSHLTDTISELFSPGSPNKLLLDTLYTTFALLLVLFGIGLLQRARRSVRFRVLGTIGASLFIVMGVVHVATATMFPQDAWGSAATLAGEMHKSLHGVIALLALASMVLIGIWFTREAAVPWFRTYSLVTAATAVLSAGFFAGTLGSPIMGLAERISMLVGFQWTFVLALCMVSGKGEALR